MTTSHARMRLYDMMNKLGERVLYTDTDSIIYTKSIDNSNVVKLGNYLGDWTDELEGKNITTFVSGGPKCYGYVLDDGSSKMKLKGFSLNYKNTRALNLTNMFTIINNGLGIQDTILTKNGDKELTKLLKSDIEHNTAKRIKLGNFIKVVNERNITRHKKEIRITSEYLEKSFKYTYTKRAIRPVVEDNLIDSQPYGF
jgi:hypothetical protein